MLGSLVVSLYAVSCLPLGAVRRQRLEVRGTISVLSGQSKKAELFDVVECIMMTTPCAREQKNLVLLLQMALVRISDLYCISLATFT
jgi:hypothetical protein